MTAFLSAHSHFSRLQAVPSPEELAQAAAQAGYSAIALTDFRSLAGVVPFYTTCRQQNIRPMIGMDLALANSSRVDTITLLAAGKNGWRSLCRIATRLNMRAEPDAPATLFEISDILEDLIVIASASGDPEARSLALLREVLPARLYAGIDRSPWSTHRRAQNTIEAAHRLDIPLVAVCPSAYLDSKQASLLTTMEAIRTNTPIEQLPENFRPLGGLFRTPTELEELYRGEEEILRRCDQVAERCEIELQLGTPHFPQVHLPSGQSIHDVLRQRAEAGAKRLYRKLTPEIKQRLDHELEIIASKGFEPIFLIMEEVISFARSSGIPVSSRGSAASSLVAHCLGITSPDPISLDLTFERFLNPARSKPPDIDTDLCSRRRSEIIQHVFRTYGEDQVAMVGTINRFRPRSALGETAKAYNLPASEVRRLVEALPHGFFRRSEENEETPGANHPFFELSRRFPGHRPVFADAAALLRMPRHFSVHAGGIVIAPGPLYDLVPLQRSGGAGVTITQMDLDSVEAFGLIKMDLLGIRGLTVLGDVANAVHSWRRSEFRNPAEVLDRIPNEDPETSQKVRTGQTIGCFQIESPGMRATLREIQASTIEDVIAALALYRPGPLQGGLKDAFVRRFKGEESVEHLHPSLAPLLDRTYGVILYQEQVLRIAYDLAGFSWADADLLRRAMSHFDPGKQMQLLQEKFVAGAFARHSVPVETGQRIWELMAAFAGYGFPKAHAASYAQVAWRSAWCKTHHPAEFMAAVLANWGGYYSQSVYLSEARRMGLRLRPPSVNHARREFSVAYPDGEPVLYMGLDQVRDLSHRTIANILTQRPFVSLDDFLTRADPNPKEGENLALSGALRDFCSIPDALNRLKQSSWKVNQPGLFSTVTEGLPEWSLAERVAAQQNVLGASVDAHPLELFSASIATSGAVSTLEAALRIGERVTVAAVRQISRRTRTARGESMLFLVLEDREGMLDAVLFPDVYRRVRVPPGNQTPMLVTGLMEIDSEQGEPVLRVEKVEKLAVSA